MGRRILAVVVAMVIVSVSGACSRDDEPRPIAVEGRVLWVHNLSADGWRDVEVWVNWHYRVTRARMPKGERFGIPLDSLVAGYGQRFNPKRQVVQRIEVKATTDGGQPVKMMWGN